MALNIRVEEGRSLTKTLVLEGRIDNESADEFDRQVEAVLGTPVKVLVLDLGKLEYITSAGLRTIFKAQKVMHARSGKAALLNPQPPVQKVLDIVKVAELGSVFRDVRELDAYLDAMQKKVTGDE